MFRSIEADGNVTAADTADGSEFRLAVARVFDAPATLGRNAVVFSYPLEAHGCSFPDAMAASHASRAKLIQLSGT